MHSVESIPEKLNFNRKYYLQFTIFDNKVTYDLDMINFAERQQDGTFKIIINKLKQFYFFSEDKIGLQKFINTHKTMKMFLYSEDLDYVESKMRLNTSNFHKKSQNLISMQSTFTQDMSTQFIPIYKESTNTTVAD